VAGPADDLGVGPELAQQLYDAGDKTVQ